MYYGQPLSQLISSLEGLHARCKEIVADLKQAQSMTARGRMTWYAHYIGCKLDHVYECMWYNTDAKQDPRWEAYFIVGEEALSLSNEDETEAMRWIDAYYKACYAGCLAKAV